MFRILLGLLLCLIALPAEARDLFVPDEYVTINQAMQAAEVGDTVRLRAGTYKEDVVIKSGVWLEGDSPFTTYLEGSGQDNVVSFVDAIGSGIRYVHVRGSGDNKASVYALDSEVTIEGNIISGGSNAGVSLYGADDSVVRNNFIHSNDENGIWILDTVAALVEFNTISSNIVGSYVYRSDAIGFGANQFVDMQGEAIKTAFSSIDFLGYSHYFANGLSGDEVQESDVSDLACVVEYFVPCDDSVLVDAGLSDRVDRDGSVSDIGAYGGEDSVRPAIVAPERVEVFVGVQGAVALEVDNPLHVSLEYEWDVSSLEAAVRDLNEGTSLSFIGMESGEYVVRVRVSNGIWSNWHEVLVVIIADGILCDSGCGCPDFFVCEQDRSCGDPEIYCLVDSDGDGVGDMDDPCPFDRFDSCSHSGNDTQGGSGRNVIDSGLGGLQPGNEATRAVNDFYCGDDFVCPAFYQCKKEAAGGRGLCVACVSDCIDNDGDGLVDEDVVDGVDNDGDGCVDEDGFGAGSCFGNGRDDDGDGFVDEDVIDCIDNDEDGLIDEDATNGAVAINCVDDLSSRPYFPDVNMEHWAEHYIDTLYEYDALHGYLDGLYKPAQPITRSEALKILMRANGIYRAEGLVDSDADGLIDAIEEQIGSLIESRDSDSDGFDDFGEFSQMYNVLGSGKKIYDIDFLDVDARLWYADYIYQAVADGLVQGYGNGYFGPYDPIRRSEFLKMIIDMRGLQLSEQQGKVYVDVPVDHWVQRYVATGKERGYLLNTDSFRPWDPILRSEAARILYRLGINVDTVSKGLCNELSIYPQADLCECVEGTSMERIVEEFDVCKLGEEICETMAFERYFCQ